MSAKKPRGAPHLNDSPLSTGPRPPIQRTGIWTLGQILFTELLSDKDKVEALKKMFGDSP